MLTILHVKLLQDTVKSLHDKQFCRRREHGSIGGGNYLPYESFNQSIYFLNMFNMLDKKFSKHI